MGVRLQNASTALNLAQFNNKPSSGSHIWKHAQRLLLIARAGSSRSRYAYGLSAGCTTVRLLAAPGGCYCSWDGVAYLTRPLYPYHSLPCIFSFPFMHGLISLRAFWLTPSLALPRGVERVNYARDVYYSLAAPGIYYHCSLDQISLCSVQAGGHGPKTRGKVARWSCSTEQPRIGPTAVAPKNKLQLFHGNPPRYLSPIPARSERLLATANAQGVREISIGSKDQVGAGW